MGLKEIKENLLQAAELVGDFEANGMEIDRDVALDKIRAAYESLRFLYEETAHETINKGDEDSEETEEDEEPEIEFEFVLPEQEDVEPEEEIVEEELLEEEVVEEELAEEEVIEEELAEEEVAEEAVEEIIEEELAEEPVTEEVVTEEIAEESVTEEVEEPATEGVEAEETAVEETVAEETEEVVTEEPKRVVAEPSLFGDDSLWGKASAPTQTQSKIMALYDDEEAVQPEPVVEPAVEVEEKIVVAPEVVVTYTEPAHQVLGEVIEAPTTIADTITPVESVAEVGSIDTLRGAISVVDRFMLIRDLFGDNEVLYEQTIDLLDRMDNLDDCIIYIAENFVWRPSSEGAKLIMDLLQRKFR